MGPRNGFQGMNSASLCSLAGRYENPIPPWCLAPIDFLKIPALDCVLSEIRMQILQSTLVTIKDKRSEVVFLYFYGAQKSILWNRFGQPCSLAGRYENPIPSWVLAPIDCSKIPALDVMPYLAGPAALIHFTPFSFQGK
jgi:hypothetical protein